MLQSNRTTTKVCSLCFALDIHTVFLFTMVDNYSRMIKKNESGSLNVTRKRNGDVQKRVELAA